MKSVSESDDPIATPEFISDSLPSHYQEVLYWSVTEKPARFIALQILGLLSFALSGLIFFSLALGVGKLAMAGSFTFGPGEIGIALVCILLTLVLHELTHGVVMRLFGAKPAYGILWKKMMLYATSPGFAYRRNAYVCILLAPLILISILVVLGMWMGQGTLWVVVLGLCGAINASGAIGDMWMTTVVLRYAPAAHVMDERDGIRVFLPR